MPVDSSRGMEGAVRHGEVDKIAAKSDFAISDATSENHRTSSSIADVLISSAGELVAKQLLEDGAAWASDSITAGSMAETKKRSRKIELDDLTNVKCPPQQQEADSLLVSAWMLKSQRAVEELSRVRKRLQHREQKLACCKREYEEGAIVSSPSSCLPSY